MGFLGEGDTGTGKPGIRTNGRAFSRFTLRQILENPVYMQASPDAYAYFTAQGRGFLRSKPLTESRGMMVYNKPFKPGVSKPAAGCFRVDCGGGRAPAHY